LTTSAGVVQLGNNSRANYIRGRGLPAGVSNAGRAAVFEQDVSLLRSTDQGMFAQQEANYEDKIIGSVGIRFDRSTLFGDQNKSYGFPRGSIATNIHKLVKLPDAINQLKVRVAYGQTAGPTNFGSLYSQLTVTGVGGRPGFIPSTIIGNPALKPETATEFEYGLDFSLFNNRVTAEVLFTTKKFLTQFNLLQPRQQQV
jgi:outer membrane receptor protein involved in Fe transport